MGDSSLNQLAAVAVARFARSVLLTFVILGFRFASPQALCFHPLRGLITKTKAGHRDSSLLLIRSISFALKSSSLRVVA